MSVKIRTKKLSDGRQSLYLDIYTHGKRSYEFLNLYLGPNARANKDTMRLAEVVCAQRQAEIGMTPYGVPLPHRQKANFIDYMARIAIQRGPSTEKLWRVTLKHVKAYADDRPVPFSSVTKVWLEGLKEYLLKAVSKATAGTYFGHVCAALRQAYSEEIIATNPANRVKGIEKPQSNREHLLFEELVQLANTPCPNDAVRRAFLYACYTGLRYSDVEKLRGADIDKERMKFRQKKTGRIEHMHLSKEALLYAGEVASDERVFDLPGYQTVNNVVKQWGIDAGLTKKITFHVARHTCATLLMTHGVDLYTVSKILGHTSIQTTEIYAKIIDQKKRAALASIPALSEARETPPHHDRSQNVPPHTSSQDGSGVHIDR